MNSKLLITMDSFKIAWLAEKIECVIKYYKELRVKMSANYM